MLVGVGEADALEPRLSYVTFDSLPPDPEQPPIDESTAQTAQSRIIVIALRFDIIEPSLFYKTLEHHNSDYSLPHSRKSSFQLKCTGSAALLCSSAFTGETCRPSSRQKQGPLRKGKMRSGIEMTINHCRKGRVDYEMPQVRTQL